MYGNYEESLIAKEEALLKENFVAKQESLLTRTRLMLKRIHWGAKDLHT